MKTGRCIAIHLCLVSLCWGSTNGTLLGWNNLGMHCMDSDYSVFSILPPYNVINVQLLDGSGNLVTSSTNIFITYEAIADPDGSINRTSLGKANFWLYSQALFGVNPGEDTGLPVPGPETFSMPGTNNTPQAMKFESSFNWFAANGVPITPYDDEGRPNSYPLMRITATNAAGTIRAHADIVLPVSDEMACHLCHSSGSGDAAKPAAGWLWKVDPGQDYRLNILRLHDEHHLADGEYQAALAAGGYNANGLVASVVQDHKPILCASCHESEALPNSGQEGLPPLTRAIHSLHSGVLDPRNGIALVSSTNRMACYSCHPGSETRCLRGAMGRAVAPDGSLLMQCQNCHGSMSDVGSASRTGWLDEPTCQACHVGGADNAYGVIRYDNALTNGVLRDPPDTRFASNPDTPAAGHSLYRFSTGHGGLQCSACHGSTHAIFPSADRNDNLYGQQLQGHAGFIGECTTCHNTWPSTTRGGPHGMHPMGQPWLNAHKSPGESLSNCRPCHGTDSRGTVLSRTFSEREFSTDDWGTKRFWKGKQISCYTCHNGPTTSSGTSRDYSGTIGNVATSTTAGVAVSMDLGTGTNVTRIVSHAAYGSVGLVGSTATYYPMSGFSGTDTFTYAANNAYNDSNLATGTVVVTEVFTFNDGVPDWWRQEKFGNGSVTDNVSCASCDPDGDTKSNLEEYLAGTDPLDDRSVPRVFDLNISPTQHTVCVVSRLGQRHLLQNGGVGVVPVWSNVSEMTWGRTDSVHLDANSVSEERTQWFRSVTTVEQDPPTLLAVDHATNSVYDSGWADGSNGGSGFSAGWSLTVAGGSGGFFVANNGSNPRLNIGPEAWGLWANSGTTSTAIRVLATPMVVGDILQLQFDNNFVSTGSQVGFSLHNAADEELFRFVFIGGQATYRIVDAHGSRPTIIPWSENGWNMQWQQVSEKAFALTCGPYRQGGDVVPLTDKQVARIHIWNGNAGNGSDYDLYVNDLQLIRP